MSAWKERVEIGPHVLYLGDCREILPTLTADAVVTDPPYGVSFRYEGHDDNRTDYMLCIPQWFGAMRRATTGPVAVSCGVANIQDWPKSDWTLAWHKPASMGRCCVGFNNWEPILLYGKPMGESGADVVRACLIPNDSLAGHPCPKPTEWAAGIIRRVALKCETILDPFMGSGTTGVACAKLGRKFIGVEIHEPYFRIACRRIADAVNGGVQPELFA